MRIVFMGTPDFSVAALNSLTEAGHQILACVTQPDKPKGRGKAVLMTPVKMRALELGIPVYQPEKVREPEFLKVLTELNPEVIVVVAFGQIISQDILDLPKYGCINIHASLLPKYRGAAPIQWALIDGETETGITTMMMDAGLDTGDMLEKEAVPIDRQDTGESLHDKLALAGGRLIVSTLEKLEAGALTRTKQPETGTCYAKKITKELGDIDWSMDAPAIERLIRALNSWPSAYSSLKGKTIKIWKAQVLDGEHEGTPGQITEVLKDGLIVTCGSGALKLCELQLEGKKRMDAGAFLRGFSVEKGAVFERRIQ
ncbi:MAG: methionyl-tRNA formyltransferase [Lachnospiraceae bacterium]